MGRIVGLHLYAALVFAVGCGRTGFDPLTDASDPGGGGSVTDGAALSDGAAPDGSAFQPFTEENIEHTAQPVPARATGAWVTLVGRGGDGGAGGHVGNQSQNAAGGRGGSGGARVGRVFIPVSAMGSTYTTTLGTAGGAFGLGADRNVRFQSGGIDMSAGWGNDASSVGGVATASGINAPLENGGAGGVGGTGAVDGSPGGSAANGAGGGGGGGGGGRSQNIPQGIGAAGGGSSGGVPVGLSGAGATGGDGSHSGNTADGGAGGGGGGAISATGSTGGIGFMRIEWM